MGVIITGTTNGFFKVFIFGEYIPVILQLYLTKTNVFMKKVFLYLAACCIVATATAQKKSVLLFGDLGFVTSKFSDPGSTKNTRYFINPGIGYQFSDKWTAGLNFGIENNKDQSGGDYSKTKTLRGGPFVRYTRSISELFNFYAQADFSFLDLTYKNSSGLTQETTGSAVSLVPAIAFKIKNGFALNFGLGGIEYLNITYPSIDNQRVKGVYLSFGKQFNIGVSKNFGGTK